MEAKKLPLCAVVIVVVLAVAAKGDGVQLISDANNVTHTQAMPSNPIVIVQQLENYDEPTLKEYQECHQNAEKCKRVCEGENDVIACAKECPICPELIKEEQVVQGVNDTQIGSSKPLNTTNIIRLTNQIHNIIDNSRGNITYRNDNVMHLYQNVSRVGGRYGMGYNNTDPCCIILQRRMCDKTKFSTASRCHRKRHRVCSASKCKSRIMEAKRVKVCDQPDPLDYFENDVEENCHETIKYVPYRQKPVRRGMHNKCMHHPYWPFVSCPRRQPHYQRPPNCGACLSVPYGNILRNGIPFECRACFHSFGRSNYYNDNMFSPYPPPYIWQPIGSSGLDSPFIDEDMDFDIHEDWKEETTKCILPDGSVSDHCIEVDGSGGDIPVTNGPELEDEFNDYDHLSGESFSRRRRQTFQRSKYSRRHRRAQRQ